MSIRTRVDARGRTRHQVRLPGERGRTFPTRKAAKAYELKRTIARASGEYEEAPPITLAEALEGVIMRWEAAKRPAPSSVRIARARAGFWSKMGFGSHRLDLLGPVEIEDAIVARAEAAPSAARVELEWLKRALKDAQRRRQRFDPALLAIPPIRNVDGREGIALELAELQWLGSWFPESINTFPEIVGAIGLRLGEALSLTDERINLGAGSVFIPKALCKEGRDKVIQLAGFERSLIAAQLMQRPTGSRVLFPRVGPDGVGVWSVTDFHKRVWRPARKAICREEREKQGLPEGAPTRFDLIVPHDLRHTAISAMAAGGMRPEVIAQRVGHADGGRLILERYRHLFPDEMGLQLAGYESWRQERTAEAGAR